jgi:hypothetical protein
MWIGKRSEKKETFPGMYDNMVRKSLSHYTMSFVIIPFKAAGGLSHDLTPTECMIKECGEEAQIPQELVVGKLKSVGAIRYIYMRRSCHSSIIVHIELLSYMYYYIFTAICTYDEVKGKVTVDVDYSISH